MNNLARSTATPTEPWPAALALAVTSNGPPMRLVALTESDCVPLGEISNPPEINVSLSSNILASAPKVDAPLRVT